MAVYHRTCSFSLSHLTQFKQHELQTTLQFFQQAGQHYIHALAQLTPNLVLHNQTHPKEQQILKLHADTKGLYQPNHISSRWLSKIAKQSYESLLAIDAKKTEQAHVRQTGKRKSKLPSGISAPNLDGSLITIQFKTDNPTLLEKYPTHSVTEKEVQNKQGEKIKKVIKTPQSVQAFTSEQWQSRFGLTHFDLVIRLSRIRGQGIKHSESIMILPFKQHAHFLQWLHHPHAKLIDSVVIHETPHRKPTKGKTLSKADLLNRLNVHLCFECTQEQALSSASVINISGRSCHSIDRYEVNGTLSAQTQLKKVLKTVAPESVYGLDVGHCKLGVLTNQEHASLENQANAFFVGMDHPQRMDQKEHVLSKYRKAVSLNQKKAVSALREHVPYQAQMQREQALDRIYITSTLKKVFKEIQASAEPMKVLVMENLNKIKIGGAGKKSLGKGFNKRNALWVVRQVQRWVIHYCQQNGILCVLVDPRYTSKLFKHPVWGAQISKCPLCRKVPELSGKSSNRKGESYVCHCCNGQTFDADYIGAHNIRQRLFFWEKHGGMPFQKNDWRLTVKSKLDRKDSSRYSGSPAPLS